MMNAQPSKTPGPTPEQIQREVDENFLEFQKMLPDLLKTHPNQWALMRDKKCVGFYDTLRDADTTGRMLYDDGLFSVQRVSKAVVDLGWFSYAMP